MRKFLLVLWIFFAFSTCSYANDWISTGNKVYLDRESVSSNKPYIKYNIKYFDSNINQDIVKTLSTSCTRVSSFYAILNGEPVTIGQNSPFYQSCIMACGLEYPGHRSITSEMSIDWTPYMTKLEKAVRDNWVSPGDFESKSITLHFKLARNGKLLAVNTVKSSGDVVTDESLISAVETTAPFEPFPSEYKGDNIEIDFVFDYIVTPAEDTFMR